MYNHHSSRFTAYASRFTLYQEQAAPLALAGLLLVGLWLRLWQLGAVYWYDEVFTATLARLPLARLWAATVADVHPPAYYLLIWATNQAVGGAGESVLRLPSLLAGLGFILVVYRLGRALDMRAAAVWGATALTALAPFQIYYSQELRAYALLMLATGLAALGLVERRSWLFIGGSLAALYLHHLAAPFIAVQCLLAITTRRWSWLKLAGIIAVIAVGYLPGAVLTVYQAGQITGNFWVPPLSSPGRVVAVLDDLIFFTPNNTFIIASGLLTGAALVVIAADWRAVLQRPYLALSTVLPLALVCLASLVWQPVLISRVMAPLTPFYYLLLADVITRNWRRAVAWGGPALVCIACIAVVGPLEGKIGRDDRAIFDNIPAKTGDAFYHANVGSYLIWSYYRPELPHYLWPNKNDLSQSLSSPTKAAMGLNQAGFASVACTHRRWWVIYFHNPTTGPAEIDYISRLQRDYPSQKYYKIRSDSASDAWVLKVEPVCGSIQAAH